MYLFIHFEKQLENLSYDTIYDKIHFNNENDILFDMCFENTG